MKTITVNVEDSKYDFILNLLKKFDFIKIVNKENVFTEAEKQILNKRFEEISNEKIAPVDWEKVKNMLE
jgi:hypothetical protein